MLNDEQVIHVRGLFYTVEEDLREASDVLGDGPESKAIDSLADALDCVIEALDAVRESSGLSWLQVFKRHSEIFEHTPFAMTIRVAAFPTKSKP